jgi:hypothetical protein
VKEPALDHLHAMACAIKRAVLAYESRNTDVLVEQCGLLQQGINDLIGAVLEQEEAAKVQEARAELAHFVKG